MTSMATVRWNVALSADNDQSLRRFLASQGGATRRKFPGQPPIFASRIGPSLKLAHDR